MPAVVALCRLAARCGSLPRQDAGSGLLPHAVEAKVCGAGCWQATIVDVPTVSVSLRAVRVPPVARTAFRYVPVRPCPSRSVGRRAAPRFRCHSRGSSRSVVRSGTVQAAPLGYPLGTNDVGGASWTTRSHGLGRCGSGPTVRKASCRCPVGGSSPQCPWHRRAEQFSQRLGRMFLGQELPRRGLAS